MALVLKDRVKETSVSTGTGAIALDGATGAYQTFSTIGNGNTTYYCIAGQTTNEWEVGIGTYTLSTDTLSRDTILSSSNSNTIVTFSAGTKDVFITYPSEKGVWLDASDDSNSAATVGTTPVRLGATTLTLAGLDSVTLTQNPSTALQAATKQYVDTLVSSGITYHAPVKYEVPDSTGNLNATYNNGTAGVGATLTNAGTQVAFTPDGFVASVNDRILVYNQTNAAQNGVYTVTTVGSVSTNWVLTRATDADSYALKSPTALGEGDAFFITSGNTGAGETYVCNTVGTITFGTTAITFTQISATQLYSAGTGLTLSGTQFSITNTAVTAASYGAASKTLTATVNAQGQLTALADANIAISMSQVTSGVLGATQGGTDQSSYSIGDILYADTTTSLARLADVAVGNALISGGLNAAPAWGKIALASAVSGTLPVANGGTGVTTSTGTGDVVLSNSPTLVTPALGTPASGNLANCTFPTLNQNTTGTAGNVTGVVAIINGGTGNTTAQGAMNTFAGATTSGQYLRGNGTNVVMAAIVAGDVPTLNQNTTGSSGSCTGNAATATTATTATSATTATTATSATTATNLAGGSAGTIPYQSAAGTTVQLTAGTAGQILQSNGAAAPSWIANTVGTVTAVTGTAPVVSSGGTTPAISMAAATTSVSGYLTSTDWNTFNGKQAAGSYVTVGGALGTPSSGTLTNCTFPTLNQNTTGSSGSCTGNAATATSAGNADTTDGYHASLVESVNTLATRNSSGYLHASYFNGTGTFATTGTTSGMARFTGTNGTDTYGRSYTVAAAAAALSGQTMNIAGSSTSCTGNSATATTCNGNYNTTNAQQNGSDGWWRSTGSAGWYSTTYSVGIYSVGVGLVQTYNSSSFQANGALYATGNVTAYYSDERLKTNLGNVNNALDSICKLNGFRYVNNDLAKSVGYESEEVQLGVSAQEVEALFPEIVSIAPFDMLHNEETGAISSKSGEEYKTVDYARLVPVLIEAIKELKAEVDELKKAK
jgi:hypothetical protein